jgi:hypothetical protein
VSCMAVLEDIVPLMVNVVNMVGRVAQFVVSLVISRLIIYNDENGRLSNNKYCIQFVKIFIHVVCKIYGTSSCSKLTSEM